MSTCSRPYQTEQKLSSLALLDCDACGPDIERFYDTSFEIVELNDQLLVMATQAGGRHLTPGRVVILRDGVSSTALERLCGTHLGHSQHFKWNLGVFLKVVPTSVKSAENKEKLYYVLAMASPDTKKRKGGEYLG